jgi:glycosyltransferase involved in cell wall biosynthesis
MDQNRRACFETLLRFPTEEETKHLISRGTDKDWDDEHFLETQFVLLTKDYQGIPCDLSRFNLTADIDLARRFMAFLMDTHNRLLYKNPITSDMGQFFAWLNMFGEKESIQRVLAWVLDQNEYKFQTECLQKLVTWRSLLSMPVQPKASIRVRLYGPYGTSGYSRAFRDIVRCLVDGGGDISYTYIPLTVQEFNGNDTNPENILLSQLLETDDVSALHRGAFEPVDIVLIHSVPDMWQPIVRRERAINPLVRTIGMTVWETDHFPFEWQPHLRCVDRICFPNRWNVQAAILDVPGVDASFLPHPIRYTPTIPDPSHQLPDALSELLDLKSANPKVYVFYTVNEFSGRKGIHLLLRAYIREFSKTDNVVLFIKTHGSVKEDVARDLISRFESEVVDRDPPNIIMDYSKWDDTDIDRLHKEGHCFVTLTRSEGHGLGACMAGLLGKRVMMTQYGGQTDYLKGIDYVPFTLTPASFCSLFDAKHRKCLDLPSCKFFKYFLPTQQNWALPSEPAARKIMRNAYKGHLMGNPETCRFLAEVCGPATIAKNFRAYFHETIAMQGPLVSTPPRILIDTYKRPLEYFRVQRSVLSQSDLALSDVTVHGRRPIVTVIGCFFYGNFGDDMYAALHQAYLSTDFDIRLCNTTTYVSKKGGLQYVDKYTPDDLQPTDYVVIGGGGLMNEAEIKSSIFRVYLPYCKANGIPLSVISTGFGFNAPDGKTPQVSDAVRKAYGELLNYANLVTIRSLSDRDVAMSLVIPERRFRVRVLPDLAYGAATIFPRGQVSLCLPETYVVFCPTTYLSVAIPDVAMLLQRKLWEHPGSVLVVLPLEGVDNTTVYPTKFVVAESERIRRMFPGALFYRGRFLSGEFLELADVAVPSDSLNQSLAVCVEIIRRASCVVTGRYHGLVMAKLFHRDVDTGNSQIVKITEELESPLEIESWEDHYEALRADILASVFIPLDSAQVIRQNPDEWDDNTRNTIITDVVTQSRNIWSPSIPFIQALSNKQLWRRKQAMLTDAFRR